MSNQPRNDALRKRLRVKYAGLNLPCGICSEPIDYKVPYPDPMSAAVDHIIPLARGGVDEASNCQPCHRSCNRTKSDHLPGDDAPARTFVTSRTW